MIRVSFLHVNLIMQLTCLELCTVSAYSLVKIKLLCKTWPIPLSPALSPATPNLSLSQARCKNCAIHLPQMSFLPFYTHLSLFIPNFFHFPSLPDSLPCIPLLSKDKSLYAVLVYNQNVLLLWFFLYYVGFSHVCSMQFLPPDYGCPQI